MEKVKIKNIQDLLAFKERELLEAWIETQLANITLREGFMSKEDLKIESISFLHEFIKAINTGNLEDITTDKYLPIIEMLQSISKTRALAGFSPSETATYVFSLKDSILQFIQKEFESDKALLNKEIIRISKFLVMMTAYVVEELVAQALQDGAYGIIYKPLDIEKAISLIGRTREKKEGAMILVVDDDPGICITLKNILVSKGYQVCIAHDGEKAVTMAKEKTYDVILIDLKLPTINGLEVYLKIKEIDPKLVAIMMTAYRMEMADLVEAALNKSAYASIYKPFDIENLLKLTEDILEKKKR